MDNKLLEELKDIYLDGFNDSENYASWFIRSAERDNILTYRLDEKLVSAGYIFYKKAKLFDKITYLPYLSALSTSKELRGKGLINNIIVPAFKKLFDRGDAFAVLNPFNPDYYKKFDFCDISYCDKLKVTGGREFEIKPGGVQSISEMLAIESVHAAGFENFLIKDKNFIIKTIEEYAQDGVACNLYMDKGKPFAYAFCSDSRVEYYATADEAKFDSIESLKGKAYDRFSGNNVMYLQGRIINARKALFEYNYLPDTDISLNISIEDRIVEQNNITVCLSVKNGIVSISNAENSELKLDISELCYNMFNGGLDIFWRQKCLFKEKY